MILAFSQVRKEILKVAPLEVDQGDPLTGGLRVLMMHDLYVFFFFGKMSQGRMPLEYKRMHDSWKSL